MVRLLLPIEMITLPERPVSIPQWCDCCPCLPFLRGGVEQRFQSHNGAIAAPPLPPIPPLAGGFNPTMVRLLPARTTSSIPANPLVSIPQWCDCCHTYKQRCSKAGSVSIPQWCDCCVCLRPTAGADANVSIPQWCDCCFLPNSERRECGCRFNPTMVRLLPLSGSLTPDCLPTFQSHNGAIAAAMQAFSPIQIF